MRSLVLILLTSVSLSSFGLNIKHNKDTIELIDAEKTLLKISIDPEIHKKYRPAEKSDKIVYLDPIAYTYGDCAVINYGNAIYDSVGSESEINLVGNTYLYNIQTGALIETIENFSTNEFVVLNKTSDSFKPSKEALLISENEGFVEKAYVVGAGCSIKSGLDIPKWELIEIAEKNGTAYVVLGNSHPIIVQVRNEKIIIFNREKTNPKEIP